MAIGAVHGRRQPPFVASAATTASKMEAAASADLHGTTSTRDNEIFDVVAPHEDISLLPLTLRDSSVKLSDGLTWSCKGSERLSRPSRTSYSAGWDHGNNKSLAESRWEVGGTGTR